MTWWLIFVLYFHAMVLGLLSGSYKASYVKVEKCEKVPTQADANPPSSFFAELYNTTEETNLLRGKIVIFREIKNLKLRVKKQIWENDKWTYVKHVYNLECNRMFFPLIVGALGVRYDLKTCTFYKGEYVFSNYNVDKILHSLQKKHKYGRYLWRIEQFSDAGMVSCYEYEILVVPAHK